MLTLLLLAAFQDKPPVAWDDSPNFGNMNREVDADIDAIVIHTTEGSLAGTLSWFNNPSSQVSAHYVIASDGAITQMVLDEDRAWHATYYNTRSIGIEMVGYSSQASTWNAANLEALESLVAYLCKTYNVVPEHPAGNAYDYPDNGDADTYGNFNAPGLVGHTQVQPWNKNDPGPYFPWVDFVAAVKAKLDAAAPTNLTAFGTIDGSTATVDFAWDASPNADGYWLDIAESQADLDAMTGTFGNFFVGAATSHTWTGLAPSTTYYWRVYAVNSYGGNHGYPAGPVTTPDLPPPPPPPAPTPTPTPPPAPSTPPTSGGGGGGSPCFAGLVATNADGSVLLTALALVFIVSRRRG